MISTKVITGLEEVPQTWIYEYYCNLGEQLMGQDITIKSLSNPNDKRPSFSIYYKNGMYRWRDFSIGEGGDHINLVIYLFGLDHFGAIKRIVSDYQAFLRANKDGYTLNNIVPQARYQVGSVEARSWNNLDAVYWTQYGINSDVLGKYNVKPLERFVFTTEDDSRPELVRTGNFIYGFFNRDGQIMKIYQPRNKDLKFIKVHEYIQGLEQLEYIQPNLIITKSLKDIMCLSTFGYNAEYIAVESESVMLRKEMVDIFKKRYKSVCTLFDSDTAGMLAKSNYQKAYGIDGIHCTLEKDPSDSVEKYGMNKTRLDLTPLLKEVLKK
jgi:hypothetical protein